jgi:hypothetical protein
VVTSCRSDEDEEVEADTMQPLCQSTLGNKSSYLAEMDRDSASEWCVNVLSRIGLVRTAVCRDVCRVIAEKKARLNY